MQLNVEAHHMKILKLDCLVNTFQQPSISGRSPGQQLASLDRIIRMFLGTMQAVVVTGGGSSSIVADNIVHAALAHGFTIFILVAALGHIRFVVGVFLTINIVDIFCETIVFKHCFALGRAVK